MASRCQRAAEGDEPRGCMGQIDRAAASVGVHAYRLHAKMRCICICMTMHLHRPTGGMPCITGNPYATACDAVPHLQMHMRMLDITGVQVQIFRSMHEGYRTRCCVRTCLLAK